jgi:D-lactate dehydrogenase (cytochrome)
MRERARHDCSFLEDLALDGPVSRTPGARESHAADEGTQPEDAVEPDAVVWPTSTADVSAVLAAATERGVPVTPYAAGSGLEGGATPVAGGVSLDLTRMDRVLDVRPGDFQVDVEPGVIGSDVNGAVGEFGLFFPPLPSSGDLSTVGGMIATDASGMGTVKYGEVADWLLELEVVLADGTVLTVGSRAAKTSSGYNLKELIVGSEGTLAVVTRATLELAGIPEQVRGGRATFPDLESATAAIADAVQSGVDAAKLELIDETSARMARAHVDVDIPAAPMAFVEFHANHDVEEEVAFCRSVFDAHGATGFEVAEADAGMDRLWEARKELAYAATAYDDARTFLHPGDVTVPIDAYADLVAYVGDVAERYDLLVPCFGHAGDGNLHYTVLVDPDDPDEVARGEAAYADVVERALELDGTATGEHGVGRGKRRYLLDEHGAAAVEAMRSVKAALDPAGTLNPGKLFPEGDVDGVDETGVTNGAADPDEE